MSADISSLMIRVNGEVEAHEVLEFGYLVRVEAVFCVCKPGFFIELLAAAENGVRGGFYALGSGGRLLVLSAATLVVVLVGVVGRRVRAMGSCVRRARPIVVSWFVPFRGRSLGRVMSIRHGRCDVLRWIVPIGCRGSRAGCVGAGRGVRQ